MKTAARLTGLLLALLLVTQGAWTMPGCEERATQPATQEHHAGMPGMPAGHHQQPAPARHHSTCELALCAMMTACGPAALVTRAPRLAPAPEAELNRITWIATSSPVGPEAPEPPPPRA